MSARAAPSAQGLASVSLIQRVTAANGLCIATHAARSGPTPRQALRGLEELREHAAVRAGRDHTDPDPGELRPQDVLAVALAVHQPAVGDGDGVRVREVLAGAAVRDLRRREAVERRAVHGRLVAEVLQPEHLLRVLARDRDEPRIELELAQTARP